MYFFSLFGEAWPVTLHNIVQIHAGQVHQRGTGAAGRMAVNEFVFLNLLFLGRSAFRGFNLNQVSETCIFGDVLDVAVDDLICKVGHLVVVFLENGLQLRVTGNGDLGTGLLLRMFR